MNIFDLVSSEEIEGLPEEPSQAFAEFTRHAYRRLSEKIATLDLNENYGWQEANEARAGFMNVILAASRQFEIEPFSSMEMPRIADFGEKEYTQFKSDLDHYMTQIVLNATMRRRSDSVELGQDAKTRIRNYLNAMKQVIDTSQFSDSQKKNLLQKIAEFEKALDGRRLSLLQVAYLSLTIAALPGGVAQSSELFAPLMGKIAKVVEAERRLEDQRRSLPRNEEPKALIAPRKSNALTNASAGPATQVFTDGLDDDIPF
jgi:hypothetical protein